MSMCLAHCQHSQNRGQDTQHLAGARKASATCDEGDLLIQFHALQDPVPSQAGLDVVSLLHLPVDGSQTSQAATLCDMQTAGGVTSLDWTKARDRPVAAGDHLVLLAYHIIFALRTVRPLTCA